MFMKSHSPGHNRRMTRERKTVSAMIGIYCRDIHAGSGNALCPHCSELWIYAKERLDRCPFQGSKTTCANCAVHCYRPSMREKIREVMRYAGPRMTYRHPLLALFHFIDGFRKSASRPRSPAS